VRTVIYARYSSQLQNARSIEDQIAVCRERADREGWTIVEIYTDYAISGAAGIEGTQRPGLNAMLARVEAGGVDQVLTESTDRIARHQGDAFAIRERLQFVGARLFTLMDGEVDDITGTIKGLMDARFRKDLGARIKRGQRGTVKDGRAAAGIAYGYRRANRLDDRGELVRGLREVDPEQAAIVRRIFEEYAAGRAPNGIAKGLNEEGVSPPRGATWRQTTILGDRQRQNGMLNNRLYAGVIVHNRTSKVVNPTTRRTVIRPNPESDWIEQDAPHLRIIDETLWQQVQTIRAESAGVHRTYQRRAKHLLSGLGRCGICGGGWIRRTGEYWACGRFHDGGGCTNNRTIKNDNYEQQVLEHLQHQLLAPELVAEYVREYHREHARLSGEGQRERGTIERRLAEAKRKVDRLVEAIAAGGAEFAEIREVLAKARTDRDTLTSQLAGIDAVPVIALHPNIAEDYRRQVQALQEALNGNPAAQLEAVPRLRALIDHVVLTPKIKGRGVDVHVIGRIDEVIGLATRKTA
jgi:DNA invertase Pin-like site-specific DNA recombinase